MGVEILMRDGAMGSIGMRLSRLELGLGVLSPLDCRREVTASDFVSECSISLLLKLIGKLE